VLFQLVSRRDAYSMHIVYVRTFSLNTSTAQRLWMHHDRVTNSCKPIIFFFSSYK